MKSDKLYTPCIQQKNTKKVYSIIINSINLYNRTDTIFMNSENRKISHFHRLLLNLSG